MTFIDLIPILIPTALLICMENTFWNNGTDVNFVDWFKISFMLYVKSGMRKKMEAAIDVLENGCLVAENFKAKDFKEEFYKIIISVSFIVVFFFFFFFFFHSDLTNLIPTFSPP